MTEPDPDLILRKLRAERDAHAARGDHAEALILNDRITDLKAGHVTVERVMQQFESALVRRRAYGPQRKQ